MGRVETRAPYRFWAATAPDVTRAVQMTWELQRPRLARADHPSHNGVRA